MTKSRAEGCRAHARKCGVEAVWVTNSTLRQLEPDGRGACTKGGIAAPRIAPRHRIAAAGFVVIGGPDLLEPPRKPSRSGPFAREQGHTNRGCVLDNWLKSSGAH
jgi:hypothetical protein